MNRYGIHLSMVLFALILIFLVVDSHAEQLDEQKKALDIIAEFADRLCKTIPLTGGDQKLELSVSCFFDK